MTLKQKCPNCGASGMTSFYKIDKVPVHSCLMVSSEKEARDFPTGNIDLGFCGSCGFVSNMAFDPTVQDYSPLYEDQQCFSPTFNAFARRLAGDLIRKYDLKNKDVVEIGCGKGDFLALICEMGNNRGVGIDPSCVWERISSPARDRITIVNDYYSERYSHYSGDMVICRHTLEHIYDTKQFVQTVRNAVGDRAETIVFFEIPDVTIVLENLVFWDVYYEHCSYFSPGSLAYLFRSCGFEVLDLYLDYDDQYLLIDAKPVTSTSEKRHPLEENLEDAAERVKRFSSAVEGQRERWTALVKNLSHSGTPPVIWGSGSKCVAFLTTLGVADDIGCVIDINPNRHGKFIAGVGKQIMAPGYLKSYEPKSIIVMNPVYRDEISEMVRSMDISAEIMTV
ncbi:MAG: methyltransferase domain-containing protein [Candidatus Latescibacterota bacterium]|nr:MAG: methyltransferase domain-containing protein [Candidatus Latescibacterota bacterium]